jgi:hypothetical protein
MAMMEIKYYACPNCTTQNSFTQPDDIHTVAKSSPCKKGDSIPTHKECTNCHQSNTIHWDLEHKEGEERFNRIAGVD